MKIKKRYLWISLSVAITFGILIGFLCFLQLAEIPLDTPTRPIDTTVWGQATGVISIFAIFLGFATYHMIRKKIAWWKTLLIYITLTLSAEIFSFLSFFVFWFARCGTLSLPPDPYGQLLWDMPWVILLDSIIALIFSVGLGYLSRWLVDEATAKKMRASSFVGTVILSVIAAYFLSIPVLTGIAYFSGIEALEEIADPDMILFGHGLQYIVIVPVAVAAILPYDQLFGTAPIKYRIWQDVKFVVLVWLFARLQMYNILFLKYEPYITTNLWPLILKGDFKAISHSEYYIIWWVSFLILIFLFAVIIFFLLGISILISVIRRIIQKKKAAKSSELDIDSYFADYYD